MQRIIEISKNTYEYYATLAIKGEQISALEKIIVDSTPLPEHHGRLIDKDKMMADILTVNPQFHYLVDWCLLVTEAQPTIIEGSDSE